LKILQKHPLKRNSLEIIFLRTAFHNIKFFYEMEQELKEQFIIALYRKLHIEKMDCGQRVFKYGT
jgi:hypothetical protein